MPHCARVPRVEGLGGSSQGPGTSVTVSTDVVPGAALPALGHLAELGWGVGAGLRPSGSAHKKEGKRDSLAPPPLNGQPLFAETRGSGAEESTCQCRRQAAQALGREDPLEKGWEPTAYSCLGHPMDRGACRVHGASESQTGLSN